MPIKPVTVLCTVASIALCASCAGGGGSRESDASLMYDHCLNNQSWLDGYNEAIGSKAMVAGIRNVGGRRTYNCFMVSRRSSEADATHHALSNCRKEFPDCYVVAQGGSKSNWVLAEEKRRRGGGNSKGSSFSASDALNVLSFGLGLANGLMGNTTTGTTSYTGSRQNRSNCAQLRENANTCYRNWQGLGGGYSGQAGSQYQCYQMYTQAYNAC